MGGPIYLFAGYAITFALGDVVYQTSLAIATTFELKDYIYVRENMFANKLSWQETPNSVGGQKDTRLVAVMMRMMTHRWEHRGADIGEHMRADISEHTCGSTQMRGQRRAHIGEHTYASTHMGAQR